MLSVAVMFNEVWGAQAAVLCVAMGLSCPAQAQQDVSPTLSRLLQCQLTHQELDNFTDRIAAGDLTDFSQSKERNGASLMLWEARTPVMAWGESSTLVHVSGVQEMLLAIPVPVGEEMVRGRSIANHIGGMSSRWDAEAMERVYGWKGLNLYKTLPGDRHVRMIVDLSYSPGWVTVGCTYGEMS
ncbi:MULTISPECIES: hypothetical protein [unclassified Stenotrophomonas]|uniref:hypothetical protein n=2 Tax=Lysobacteraceae TaxID=32033 RepID=UPI003BF84535